MSHLHPLDERAARALIQADLERLGGPARGRYRAALRRLLREAQSERAPGKPSPARITDREIALVFVGGCAVASLTVLVSPAIGAFAAACGAGILALSLLRDETAPAPKLRFADDDAPASMAMSLHRAAMAESRREYYSGASAAAH